MKHNHCPTEEVSHVVKTKKDLIIGVCCINHILPLPWKQNIWHYSVTTQGRRLSLKSFISCKKQKWVGWGRGVGWGGEQILNNTCDLCVSVTLTQVPVVFKSTWFLWIRSFPEYSQASKESSRVPDHEPWTTKLSDTCIHQQHQHTDATEAMTNQHVWFPFLRLVSDSCILTWWETPALYPSRLLAPKWLVI